MRGAKLGASAWTGPEELRRRLRRDWDSGRLPAAILRAGLARRGDSAEGGIDSAEAVEGRPGLAFPLRIILRGPSSAELGERFSESRAWIASLGSAAGRPGYELEWHTVEHRQLGRNEVPVAALLEAPEDAVALIGKRREAARLLELAREIAARFPALLPWLGRHPLEVLERGPEWPALLGCLAWFCANPRSGRYLRQIDAPGVHSKFVEARRGLLTELLDLVLDPAALDGSAGGAVGFSRRYGLREKPALVRFRSLDQRIALRAAGLASVAELCLRAEDFSRLFDFGDSPFAELFVTENEINYLAFPERPRAAIILGSGYGFSALAEANWLRGLRLRYWGDLDTHGFAILNQFRATFAEAESFLMDRETLLAHRELWTSEPKPTRAELGRLTPAELGLYEELRADKLAPALRLEQERIGFFWLEEALKS